MSEHAIRTTDAASAPAARHARTGWAWVLVTRVLVAGVFSQAVFAGVLLSGVSWGRTVHETNR